MSSKETGPGICLLLAAERSGTHLLRSLLANLGAVAAPGEICNVTVPESRTSKASFFRFKREACLENPELFFPSQPAQSTLLDDFVASLRSSFPDSTLMVLDVKYAHVHNFNFFWWDPLQSPYLLQYAKRKGFKVIHLVRHKVYRTAISGFYASETGIWRARDEHETRQISISIDRGKLEKKAQLLARTISRFEGWLSACPHLRISYESLSEERPAALKALKEYLGLKTQIPDKPGFVKTTPSLEGAIQNYQDVASLVDLDYNDVLSSAARRKKRRPGVSPA